MSKIARKYLAHFINAAKSGAAVYERLGKDLEEYVAEFNAEVEKKKNILGETSVMLSSYEKQGSVEPWYAESGSALFTRLQGIIDNDYVLDDVASDVVEVKLWETPKGTAYPAVKETVCIEVTSYGGDSTGYQIPFNVHYTGIKTTGTFDIANKTFTPGTNIEYLVTFNVNDGTNQVVGVQITVNGKVLTSDPNGMASASLAAGTFDYSVIASGYTTGTGSITVSTAAVLKAVTLVSSRSKGAG